MQQIFLCPTCGAQNLIGQEYCQVCGQRFQYNCPYCGAIVDTTLVNCPRCRESLYWPTPQKVKPFPKHTVRQIAVRRDRAEMEEEKGGKPEKKQSDLWLIGCLGLVIIAILAMGVYFVYDNFIKRAPTPELPPSSNNQTGFQLSNNAEGESIGKWLLL